ncbi:MAG: type 3 dihydrofolate reductase [Mariprofundus sp.]|nr:type 3 dihydrofolate reductase [Mariprofundus sp.]
MSNDTVLSLIWAMDINGLIGRDNTLPWKLPADMAWFKKSTMGKPILMGRKTLASIGRPLPGRTNLILTRQTDLQVEGCTVVHSLDAAKQAVPDADEIMVMGGAEIYALLFDQADRLYITEIDATFEGDTWFPNSDRSQWKETFRASHQPDQNNTYPYAFIIMERK